MFQIEKIRTFTQRKFYMNYVRNFTGAALYPPGV